MATDEARAAVFTQGYLGTVSDWMTPTVASRLEFHELVPYKNLLKRFFSAAPWNPEDEARLSDLVAPKLDEGWSESLDLGDGLVVTHGLAEGTYRIEVVANTTPASSVWDRVFEGPVVPEPTPHPRKVKFDIGGEPAPGVWYRRYDEPDDPRVLRLFDEPDITDVMVAGDFVTVGIERRATWEDRLDDILGLVTSLFPHGDRTGPERTREELVAEGRALDLSRPDELHLLDPDDPAAREALLTALGHEDPRVRRVAVVVLAESDDADVARGAIRTGFADEARIVKRASVDVGADLDDEALRQVFEEAATSPDDWLRWKAVRAIGDLGLGPSRDQISALADDESFQVRFEVERVLRADD